VTAEAKALPRMTPGADDGAADDPTRVVTEDTPSRRSDAGAAWGTLIHGLLEHAMRHKTATREDLRRLAMWLTVDQPGLRAVIDEAADTVRAVSNQEFWVEAKASPECQDHRLQDGCRCDRGATATAIRRAGGRVCWRLAPDRSYGSDGSHRWRETADAVGLTHGTARGNPACALDRARTMI
jgi:hypothetical protein